VALIFIYILIISFFFSNIKFLSFEESRRLCSFFSFKIDYNPIFLEPSHLGMVLVPFFYFIFSLDKLSKYNKIILYLFFIFIFIFYYSVTFLFSVIVCFLLTLIINYRFFFKNKFFFVLQLIVFVLPIYKSSCVFKVTHTLITYSELEKNIIQKKNEQININQNFTLLNSDESQILDDSLILTIDEKINKLYKIIDLMDYKKSLPLRQELSNLLDERALLFKKIFTKKNINKSSLELNNLIRKNADFFPIDRSSKINDHTTAVILNALHVTYNAFKEKPIGWGFNNYQSAFHKFVLYEIIPPFVDIYYLNYNDASSNLLKLIVEYGVFSIFIFINLLYFVFNRKIPDSQKILLSSIIAIQMIRGAGYFNGGFSLCLILTFFLNFESLKKK